jgi:hypothetical protein
MSTLGGEEGKPFTVVLSASLVGINDTHIVEGLVLHVSGFPRGSTFNKGSFNGSVWTFTGPEFGEVELTLPQFFSGEIILSAAAVFSGTVREGTLHFMVEAVANPPNLTVGEACFNVATGSINFSIDSSLVDEDGSETLLITLSNIPEGITPLVGQMNSVGEYILTSEYLTNITFNFVGSIDAFNITILATSFEMTNLAMASTNTSLLIQECDECQLRMHNCAQLCVNIVGSFTCDCYAGYELDSNGYSCNSELSIAL